MEMQALTNFLYARLTEDEALSDDMECLCPSASVRRPDCPERVFVECEAKRQIVELSKHAAGFDGVLKLLAVVYADHPDYREEWKP